MNAFSSRLLGLLGTLRRRLLMLLTRVRTGYAYGLGATDPVLTTGGAVVMAASPAAGPFAPVFATVGALMTFLGVLGVGGGCGPSCVAASNDANAVELALKANLAAFLHGQIDQATAISNFNALWLQLQEGCAQIGGSAGQACISDRQAGACKWLTSSGGWDAASCTYNPPGAAGSGSSCWNWDVGYSSPIVNAPACFLDSSAGAGTSAVAGGGIGPLPGWVWWLAGGLVAAEVFS
jgi:hypothetical protein